MPAPATTNTRRLLPLTTCLLSAWLPACLTQNVARIPESMGGSVTDFDRGTGGFYSPATGGAAGAPYTVGVASTDGSRGAEGEHLTQAGPPPDGRRNLVAGPIVPQASAPENVRRVQRALKERGYYQGPLNGLADPALEGALRRFQIDHGLPETGALDVDTADALEIRSTAVPSPGAG